MLRLGGGGGSGLFSLSEVSHRVRGPLRCQIEHLIDPLPVILIHLGEGGLQVFHQSGAAGDGRGFP